MLNDLLPTEQDWTRALVRGRLEHPPLAGVEVGQCDHTVRNRSDSRWCDQAAVDGQARPSRALARAHEATVGHRVTLDDTGAWAYKLAPGHTRGSGADFTPPALIRYMVRATLGHWLEAPGRTVTDIAAVRILDPACGAGVFLAEALELLVDWAEERGQQVDPAQIAKTALVGLDVDPRAVSTARRVIALRVAELGSTLPPSALEVAVRVGNTLVPGTLDGTFDVVLGNPPYVFGEYVDKDAKAQWATHFSLGRAGQPDAFKLFYERTAGELLRPGGVHGFVVPDAMIGRDGHADLRRWLLRNLQLVTACHVGPVFRRGGVRSDGQLQRAQRVGVSGVVVVGERDAQRDGAQIRVDHWTSDGPEAGHHVDAVLAARTDGSPWVLHAPAGWLGPEGLRSKMERLGVTLNDVLLTGTAGLTRGEELGKQSLQPRSADPSFIPIYSGDCVRRYRPLQPRLQGPRDLVAKPESFYAGPKILFVKTGAGPVAARVPDDFPALQSVYMLHVVPEVPTEVVVGIICSALITAYSWYQWTSAKRQQPQFTLGNLRSIPLPRVSASQASVLVEAVRRAEQASQADAAAAEYRVDELIAQLYGLSLGEIIPLLSPALNTIPASQRPAWWGHPDFRDELSVR